MAWSIIPRTLSVRVASYASRQRVLLLAVRSSSSRGPLRKQSEQWESSASNDLPPSASLANVGFLTPGQAHVVAPKDIPLLDLTLGRLIERAARKYADREAVASLYEKRSLTYEEVLKEADEVAAGLLALGLQPGDRVALWGPNSVDWVICKFAIVRAGMILVTLNPAYQAPELKYGLETVGAKAVICATQLRTQNFPQMLSQVIPELSECPPGKLRSKELPELRVAIIMSDEKYPGFLRLQDTKTLSNPGLIKAVRDLQDGISARDVCEIQYTSGTTGKPKGCMLTHHSMVNNAMLAGNEYPVLGPDGSTVQQRTLVSIPFFHVYASVIGIVNATYYGNTVVLASSMYEPDKMIKALHEKNCTTFMTAPTILVDLVNQLKGGSPTPQNLHYVITGGGMANAELFRSLREVLPNTFIGQGYGMTETSTAVTVLPRTASQEQLENTVGAFLPHTEAKVVDAEGNTVPIDTPGELVLRGYMTTPGYWKDPVKTRELFDKQGWLRTGDLFKIRSDGYAVIIGRIKDMILRGGENVYPKEVEDVILTHPSVAEVQVFPVSDQRLGEEVACVLKLNKGELTHEELRSFLKEKLAYFKIPRHFKIVDEIPRTATGKPQKFKLREMMEEHIKAQSSR